MPFSGITTQEVSGSLTFGDDERLIFGTGSDVHADWSTAQATAHMLVWGIRAGGAAGGGGFILTAIGNANKDHDHAAQTNPTLFVHSATDPDTANTQWVSLAHNQTNGVLNTGTGNLTVGQSIVSDTTGTDDLGSATIAWATMFGNAFRGANNTAVSLSTVQVAAGGGPTLSLVAAAAVTAGVGGAITLTAGLGVGANAGGAISLTTGVGGVGAGGAGGALTLATAAAGAASGAAGGALILTTGAGDGAGARGVIRLDDAGAALSVLPTTTNLVTVGSTDLALAATYTNIVQPATGQGLLIRRSDGVVVATISGATANCRFSQRAGMNDDMSFEFGSSGSDVRAQWSTSSANNALYIATGVNSAAQSGNIILTTLANIANEHGLAAVATPRLAIFSAADMSVAGNRTQYIQMYHDGTNGIIDNGIGRVVLSPSNAAVNIGTAGTGTLYVTTISRNSGTTVLGFSQMSGIAVTQTVQTSGTPTGLLWTAGAHTRLTASVESIDQNWDNARTVQFATGALALQRSVLFQAPTYGFVGASTIDDAYTVYVDGAPIAGTNATITRSHALGLGGRLTLVTSVDSVAVADQVSLSRYEIGVGNTVLAISQETAVAVDADETKFSNKVQVRINGATYFVMLTTT